MDAEPITLALGPTNTGKTHRAVERLLEHDSGMLGLPLRLLAREVYDRVTARIGEGEVALVTGEEKRVPPRPRYWICTVEAMPRDIPVDFVAIDEIQLAAHRERGHVFTDRLLNARGRLETWFLGADTIAPIARELLRGASLRRQPRLSTLRHAGRSGLGGLPPRSAVVAFSASEVYELAARLRARRGGAAVVLGALSPRTRNAQVALYQAGEVSYLVATDAIGMGLNLDVNHVAFASLDKFDGRHRRLLEPAELAQIAGRAGRHRADGTFGTLNPLPGLDARVSAAIEEHRFAPVRQLVWRNAELDFDSLEGLVISLAAAPPSSAFTRVEQADDFDALRALMDRPEVRGRATSPSRVALLWETCQVPDYRKLLLLRHIGLLGEIFVQLVDRGRLADEWVAGHVERIDRLDGDLDTLTARLAEIRVWTYVSHRGDWLEDADRWRARTRDIEDRLGDALHERLVERFVEVGRKRTVEVRGSAAGDDGPFAKLAELLEVERRQDDRAKHDWVEALLEAEHDELTVADDATIAHQGRMIAKFVAGRGLTEPAVTLLVGTELGAGARARIERRLTAFAKDFVRELLAPLASHDTRRPAVRGLLYQLERGLGTVARRDARAQLEALDDEASDELDARGITIGQRTVHARPLLSDEAIRSRAILVRLHAPGTPMPAAGAVSIPFARDGSVASYLSLGLVPVGPRAIRADVVEDALDELGRLARGPFDLPEGIDGRLGASGKALRDVLFALGYRQREDERWEARSRRRRRRPRAR